MLSPTKPVPPKTRILIAQPERVAADGSQQPRTEILLRVHIGYQSTGRLRRLTSRARKETPRSCFDRTFAVRHDDAPARQHRDRPAAQFAAGEGRVTREIMHQRVAQRDLALRIPDRDVS